MTFPHGIEKSHSSVSTGVPNPSPAPRTSSQLFDLPHLPSRRSSTTEATSAPDMLNDIGKIATPDTPLKKIIDSFKKTAAITCVSILLLPYLAGTLVTAGLLFGGTTVACIGTLISPTPYIGAAAGAIKAFAEGKKSGQPIDLKKGAEKGLKTGVYITFIPLVAISMVPIAAMSGLLLGCEKIMKKSLIGAELMTKEELNFLPFTKMLAETKGGKKK